MPESISGRQKFIPLPKIHVMKKSFGLLAIVAVALLMAAGCMRNDDEPLEPTRPISRLYVSFQDTTQGDTTLPVQNVGLIDPADSTFDGIDFNHSSGALGGAGIFFSPGIGRAFQAGRYDTTVRVMQVTALGQLGNTGRLGNRLLTGMRGLTYYVPAEMLYVTNIGTPSSYIYGFYRPMNQNGYTAPSRRFRLDQGIIPWSVITWNEDSLLVSNSASAGGVILYGGISEADSAELRLSALSNIRIVGASSIRGIAFVDSLDVLVAADYGDPQENVGGKVYIIEGIKAHLAQSSASVTPTRVISGPLTGLSGPVDVAIDPREGRMTVYVADQIARRVSRFKLSDVGNVEPEASVTFDSPRRTPFAIYLDARGVAQ